MKRGETMIPNDPVMLLSYVNTQLRDHYADLEQMCQSLDIDQAQLEAKLHGSDYAYDRETNQFV